MTAREPDDFQYIAPLGRHFFYHIDDNTVQASELLSLREIPRIYSLPSQHYLTIDSISINGVIDDVNTVYGHNTWLINNPIPGKDITVFLRLGDEAITLSDTTIAASDLNSLDNNTTGLINTSNVMSITGSIDDMFTALASSGIKGLGDLALTLSDTTIDASDLNILDNNTTGLINAGNVMSITGAINDINTAYTSSGITGLGDPAMALSDTTVAASDLNTLDNNTTGLIDASSVTNIMGTAYEINTAYSSSGITGLWNPEVTLSDTTIAAYLNSLDNNTNGLINASNVTNIRGAIADINTAYASSGITGLGNPAVTLSDTTIAASDLNSLDNKTSGTIDASTVSSITGTASDIYTAYVSSGITRLRDSAFDLHDPEIKSAILEGASFDIGQSNPSWRGENGPILINITARDLNDLPRSRDLPLYWSISGDEIDSYDFNENSYEGSIGIRNDRTKTIELLPKADNKTEGDEKFNFSLYADPENKIELKSSSFILKDTSKPKQVTYEAINNKDEIEEGPPFSGEDNSIVYASLNISSGDIRNHGDEIYWQILSNQNTLDSYDFITPLSGSLEVDNDPGENKIWIGAKADDSQEGTESFTVNWYSTAKFTDENLLASSDPITIKDTSIPESYLINNISNSIDENGYIEHEFTPFDIDDQLEYKRYYFNLVGDVNNEDFYVFEENIRGSGAEGITWINDYNLTIDGSTSQNVGRYNFIKGAVDAKSNEKVSLKIPVRDDQKSEGSENVQINWYSTPNFSTEESIASSELIEIRDTSTSPVYYEFENYSNPNRLSTTVFEKETVKHTITPRLSNQYDPTKLYWRIESLPGESDLDRSVTIDDFEGLEALNGEEFIYKDITTNISLTIKDDGDSINEYYQVGWYTDPGFQDPVSPSFQSIEIGKPREDYLDSVSISTPSYINEGESIKLDIQGIVDIKGEQSSELYWTARGTNINAQDFTSIRQIAEQEESFRPGAVTFLEGETIEGQLNLTGDENKASIFLDVNNDLKSEKDETVNVEFFSSLSDKLTNQPIANTSFVIRDTSKGIPSIADQYFIDAPAYVNEGETYYVRLTPDGLPEFDNPQQLYYDISGEGIDNIDLKVLNLDSTFSTTGQIGSQTITAYEGRTSYLQLRLLNDSIYEGDENLDIKFYLDANKSTQVGETVSTTILDTSVGNSQGLYSITTTPSVSINEGGTLAINFEATNLPEAEVGVTRWWRLFGAGIEHDDQWASLDHFNLIGGQFSPNSSAMPIHLEIKDDGQTDGDEVLEIKLYETYDQYRNWQDESVTPLANASIIIKDPLPPTYQIRPYQYEDGEWVQSNSIEVNEGDSINIGVDGSNLRYNTATIYYQLSGNGIEYTDFNIDDLYGFYKNLFENYLKGSISIDKDSLSPTGESIPKQLTFDVKTDQSIEADETLNINFYSDSARTQQFFIDTASITIKDATSAPEKTYSITTNNEETINEGDLITTNITTTNVNDGENIFWTLSGNGINQNDFSLGSLSGFSTIVDQKTTIEHSLFEDNETEGLETLSIDLYSDPQRSNSLSETLKIEINDTSREDNDLYTPISETQSYSLTTNANSINEGELLTTSIVTEGISDGSNIYLKLSGDGINSDDFNSGELENVSLILNNQARFSHLLSNDFSTEGTETIDIKLFSDSEYTQQILETKSVLINDTSIDQSLTTTIIDATALNNLDATTDSAIDASSVIAITGAIADINAAYTSSGITGLDDVAVTLSDKSTTASTLINLEATTDGSIDATSVTTIKGSIDDIDTVYASSGITGLDDTSVTLSDTTTTAGTLINLEATTNGAIDATSVTTIKGSIDDINTVYASSGITGLADTSVTLSDTTTTAGTLNSLNEKTNGKIDATSVTTIKGSINEINTVYASSRIKGLSTFNQIGNDIDGEDANDCSGQSVSLSADGSIVAIGAYKNDGNGADSGHVRIFKNHNGNWTQIGSDIDGVANDDYFGFTSSLSSNGSIVAIGAPGHEAGNKGHVRIYQNNNNTWQQIGDDIDGEADWDNFGRSVSLSADGSIAAIGAYQNDGNGPDSGHVRIFKNHNGTWQQIGGDIDGEAANDKSGQSISLSADGSIVAIGAYFNDGNGVDSGHVRIYQNNNNTWQKIGDDIDGEADSDYSGFTPSLSSNGSIVAIGAPGHEAGNKGHVRIYQNNNNTWQQIGGDIDGEADWDNFGRSVSLSDDGSIVAIGAYGNDGNGPDSGHVRIFKNDNGTWQQIGSDIDGEAANDKSGQAETVSLSADGSIVAIGAYLNDGNGVDSGHVRVFNIKSTNLNLNDSVTTASSIHSLATTINGTIDASSVGTISGSIEEINATYASSGISGLENTNFTLSAPVSASDLNALDRKTTGIITANVLETDMTTLVSLTNSYGNNAYTNTVKDTTVSATALNTLAAATNIAIDASAIQTITGSIEEINAAYASNGITGLGVETVTLTDVAIAATDLKTLGTATSGAIDASSVGSISGSIDEINAAYAADGITGLGVETVTLTDVAIAATDLKTLGTATSGAIDASSVGNISGSIDEINAAYAADGITGLGVETVTLTDVAIAATDLKTLGTATSSAIDASSVGNISGSIDEINAAYLSPDIKGLGSEAITLTDTSATATTLIILNHFSSGTINASTVKTITGAIADINTVYASSGITGLGDIDMQLTGEEDDLTRTNHEIVNTWAENPEATLESDIELGYSLHSINGTDTQTDLRQLAVLGDSVDWQDTYRLDITAKSLVDGYDLETADITIEFDPYLFNEIQASDITIGGQLPIANAVRIDNDVGTIRIAAASLGDLDPGDLYGNHLADAGASIGSDGGVLASIDLNFNELNLAELNQNSDGSIDDLSTPLFFGLSANQDETVFSKDLTDAAGLSNREIKSLRELGGDLAVDGTKVTLYEATINLQEQGDGLILSSDLDIGSYNSKQTNLLRSGDTISTTSTWTNLGNIEAQNIQVTGITNSNAELVASESYFAYQGIDANDIEVTRNSLNSGSFSSTTGEFESAAQESGELHAAIKITGAAGNVVDLGLGIASLKADGSDLFSNQKGSKNLITYQGDLNYDGRVSMKDLAYLNAGAARQQQVSADDSATEVDANNDGVVDASVARGVDANFDGQISMADLAVLDADWGQSLHQSSNGTQSSFTGSDQISWDELDSQGTTGDAAWDNQAFKDQNAVEAGNDFVESLENPTAVGVIGADGNSDSSDHDIAGTEFQDPLTG